MNSSHTSAQALIKAFQIFVTVSVSQKLFNSNSLTNAGKIYFRHLFSPLCRIMFTSLIATNILITLFKTLIDIDILQNCFT